MNSKWMVYAKKADFKQIASEYGIDQVLARIIRNRDICGSKDIDMYINGNINDNWTQRMGILTIYIILIV